MKRLKNFKIKIISLKIISILSFSATASVTTFTDRASFEAASGQLISENFNSITAETSFRSSSLDLGDFSLSMSGSVSSSSQRNFIDIPPLSFPNFFNVDNTSHVNVLLNQSSSLLLNFDIPIFEFGADFSNLQDDEYRIIINIAGETITPSIGDDGVRFLGFKSNAVFSTVEFESVFENDGFAIDNLSYSAIPIPAGVWLFGSALAGLGVLRRRK